MTPFGSPVVFGALGALAALSALECNDGQPLLSLDCQFQRPMFTGIDYTLSKTGTGPGRRRLDLYDGSTTLLSVTLVDGSGEPAVFLDSAGTAPLTEANRLDEGELTPGRTFTGLYAPDPAALASLFSRFAIDPRRHAEAAFILLWSSYFTGMEVPGERAIYFKLAAQFSALSGPVALPIRYRAQILSHDRRLGLTKTEFHLESAGGPFATGTISAFLRPAQRQLSLDTLFQAFPVSDAMQGKVALVTGSSRGLGASLAAGLVRQGCTVIGSFVKSTSQAEGLQKGLKGANGRLILKQGDAGDPVWCADTRHTIMQEFGRLDVLICNASLALHNYRLELAALSRICSFIDTGCRLVATPMAAFLDLLAQCGGCHVLISSQAVVSPPALWPHYVAMKAASEALVHAAALQYPDVRFLIVRPRKLQTDLVNTPMGQQDATPPEEIAARILSHLTQSTAPGEVQFLP